MNKYHIKVTWRAKDDIINIGDYISYTLLEPDTSNRFIQGLKKSISQLSYFPRKFPVIQNEDIEVKDIRCMPYKNYYVFYQINESMNIVIILRVGYNRRNWKEYL